MKFLISAVLLMAFNVYAKEVGNGGDAIVCRSANGEITRAELLDYYEGRVMRKLPVVEYNEMADEDFYKVVGNKVNSLEDFTKEIFDTEEAITLGAAIEEHLLTGTTSIGKVLFTDEELTDIPDSGQLIMPKGCKVEQLAIWQLPKFPEDPSFIIQSDILKKLSARDRRGLVLHEILYKTMFFRNKIENQELKDSYIVRYLHQKLMSRNIDLFTFKDYLSFLKGMYSNAQEGCIYIQYKCFNVKTTFEVKDAILISTSRSDVYYALDLSGKLSRDLTFKYGYVIVGGYASMGVAGHDPGTVTLREQTVKMRQDWVVQRPLQEEYEYVILKFGQNSMKVNLNPLEGISYTADFGVYFTDQGVTSFVTEKAQSSNVPQVLTQDFFIDLDENMNTVVR